MGMDDMTYGASRNVLQADLGSSSGGCEEERDVGELHRDGYGKSDQMDWLKEWQGDLAGRERERERVCRRE